MKNETLLDKAIQNFNCAKSLLQNLGNDEVYLNYVGYHLQQSVELSIKYNLEKNGIEYSKTHDITQLINLAKQNNINSGITEYIDEHSEMFTVWESKTRYILNYCLEKGKIEKAINEIEKYLENQIENAIFENKNGYYTESGDFIEENPPIIETKNNNTEDDSEDFEI